MLYLVDIFVSYSPPLFPLAGGLRVLHRRHHYPHQIHIMLDLYSTSCTCNNLSNVTNLLNTETAVLQIRIRILWVSWIRIRICHLFVRIRIRIRILPSTRKKEKS
jgi:hypothetical protein